MTNDTTYNTNGSTGWYNIGLWDCTAAQNAGAHLKLRILGCYGYNGGNVTGTQAGGETTIYLTNLNNANTGVVNVDGWWKHEGGTTMFTSVKVVSAGGSRFKYNIWAYIQGNTNHALNAETTAGTIWTSQLTGGSDPGANSATVQLIVLSTVAVGTNVGIGTNNTQFGAYNPAKLVVAADVTLNAGNYAGDVGCQIQCTGLTLTSKRLALMYDTTNNIGLIQAQVAGTGNSSLCLNAAGGNIGIGTTNPGNTLDITVVSAAPATARVFANSDAIFLSECTNSTNYAYYRLKVANSGTALFGQVILNNSGELILSASSGYSTGQKLVQGSSAWAAVSDARVKNIIEPISNALIKVEQINPCIYSLKEDTTNRRRVGVIAQDVYKVLPEAVNGTPDSEEIMSVGYTDLIPLTIQAIKDLLAKNSALEARLAALEAKLA
jgi:hypothetical protein